MKVDDKRDSGVSFGALSYGACFELADRNHIFIKVQAFGGETIQHRRTDYAINTNGEPFKFGSSEMVTPRPDLWLVSRPEKETT